MHDAAPASTPTLDELLRARGLSDRAVQRLTGIAPLTLRKLRVGSVQRPSWLTCSRLAALLGVDTLDVLSAATESIRRARARMGGAS